MQLSALLTVCPSLYAQTRTITGVVTSSEDGEPLIGATVTLAGKESQGVITDTDGKFTLQIDPDAKMLSIAFVGMKTREVRIPGKGNVLQIVLEPEAISMDEVVVTGYGNFTKSSFTGSANTLKGDMMKDIPVMSVEQKLQGFTTGVNITSSSGQPGANQSIRIRGMGSFNASQEPLFVIDGVPVS